MTMEDDILRNGRVQDKTNGLARFNVCCRSVLEHLEGTE